MVGRNNSANVHAWVEERLSEYLDNRLAATERAQIEQHLRECADCRASFESLRWTVALVKQAPAPALPRAFTLPVPAQRAPQRSAALGLAQFATALVTLLLIAVIGVDVITQLGGGMMASAPSAAKQYAAPTLAVAAVPATVAAAPTTVARDQAQAVEAAKPTQAPKPAAPTAAPTAAPPAAPQPTMAPPTAMPAPMSALPTALAPRAAGSAATETPETKGTTADNTAKSSSATPAVRAGLTISATATMPAPTATLAPTATATNVPPTATALPSPTQVAQTRAEATHAPQPTQVPFATAQPFVTPLRAVELGLLIAVIFFGALVVAMWRRN